MNHHFADAIDGTDIAEQGSDQLDSPRLPPNEQSTEKEKYILSPTKPSAPRYELTQWSGAASPHAYAQRMSSLSAPVARKIFVGPGTSNLSEKRHAQRSSDDERSTKRACVEEGSEVEDNNTDEEDGDDGGEVSPLSNFSSRRPIFSNEQINLTNTEHGTYWRCVKKDCSTIIHNSQTPGGKDEIREHLREHYRKNERVRLGWVAHNLRQYCFPASCANTLTSAARSELEMVLRDVRYLRGESEKELDQIESTLMEVDSKSEPYFDPEVGSTAGCGAVRQPELHADTYTNRAQQGKKRELRGDGEGEASTSIPNIPLLQSAD
ncbi:hypothetical protein HOY80DRAFT_1106729 [Tuber brumale]|nr:hypothetical protein HOY80DRAFT_1106729 [Tuber brumale]